MKLSKRQRIEEFYGILFALPVILGFIIFVLGPMISSFGLSLTDYRIVNTPKFVGLDNYVRLFSGEDKFFYKSIGVTIHYAVLSVPLQIIFAFLIALLMNQNFKGKSIFRTIFYLPTIVPVVASSMIWLWLLNPDLGLLNQILKTLGLPTSKWIFSEKTVINSLVVMSLWTIGGQMVIFLAGLQGIPNSLYEAAQIDGCGPIKKLIHITLPMMTPTIFFNLIMGVINGLQIFTQAFVITHGGPNNASLFYILHLFRTAFKFSEMGQASALAWVLFTVILIITVIIFKTSNKWVFYQGGDAE